MSNNRSIYISDDIRVELSAFPKKNKTHTNKYCIYVSFSIYNKGLKQSKPHTISTGITINITEWVNGEVTGRNEAAKQKNALVRDYLNNAESMLDELRLKKVNTYSHLAAEIKLNAKQRVTGKAARGQKQNLISRLKEYSYEDVMNILLEKRKICVVRQRAYNTSCGLLKAFYAGEIPPINQITTECLEEFMEWLDKREYTKGIITRRYANDSKTDYKSKIAAVILYAIKPMKIITANPLPEAFRGNWVDDAKKDILDESEMYDFMQLDESKLTKSQIIGKLLGIVQGFTSIGFGDMKSLEYSHFKELKYLDDNMEKVIKPYIQKDRDKTNEGFTVFLPAPIKKYIDRLIGLIGDEKKPFNLFSDTHVNNTYKDLIKMAGIGKKITSNNFRHTLATDYIEKGGRYEYLDVIMGHKSKDNRMTKQYAKITLKAQSDAMELYVSKCKVLQPPTQPVIQLPVKKTIMELLAV